MKLKRSKHNLSSYSLLSGDMGQLIPAGQPVEVLPGDTFDHSSSILLRADPLVAPVMHPVEVRIHHFYVPTRLLWSSWEDFITGGPDGNDASVIPTITEATATANNVADYFGIPRENGITYNALPIYAYNSIYNEFFRDQDICPESALASLSIQRIAWEKDYFTMARPWAQKGDAVSIPLAGSAPVTGIGGINQIYSTGPINAYETDGTASTSWAKYKNDPNIEEDPLNPGFPNIRADLSNASGIPVTDLRKFLALQNYKEARARFGSRYTEYLAYLGINAGDSRLQRPEYLGGGKQTISFSEVLATAESTGINVGDLKGHGIAALRSNRYRRFFPEHGYVVSLLSVRPKAMYEDGLARMWSRVDKEDYYQRELELIGQQEIKNKEVFAAHGTPDGVFGHGDRYDEYRKNNSVVTSTFRTTDDVWHYARDFASAPALNQSFIECNPTKRTQAVLTNPAFKCMVNHRLRARRVVRRNSRAKIL